MFLFVEFLLINLESFPFSMLSAMSHILIPYFSLSIAFAGTLPGFYESSQMLQQSVL